MPARSIPNVPSFGLPRYVGAGAASTGRAEATGSPAGGSAGEAHDGRKKSADRRRRDRARSMVDEGVDGQETADVSPMSTVPARQESLDHGAGDSNQPPS